MGEELEPSINYFQYSQTFLFQVENICPKNYQICKFCIIFCKSQMFRFRTNTQEILIQKKLENLEHLSYNSRTKEIPFFFFFNKLHCHSFCHLSSTKEDLTFLTLNKIWNRHHLFTTEKYNENNIVIR